MRVTAMQEAERYLVPQRGRSVTNDIVSLISYAIDQQINGDKVYAQHILNQLITSFPSKAPSIRITAANMLTERITNDPRLQGSSETGDGEAV